MRVLIHLSDLHFGKVAVETVAPLVDSVNQARPDVTVISGDFVQWGTRSEFAQAREFVEQLPEPRILVPGNHDMPFGNVFQRFTVGLDYFRDHITDDLSPTYLDDEIAIMGVNTARRSRLRGGRISERQVREVEEWSSGIPDTVWKVLVSHHPFDLAGTYHHRELVGRARMAMGRFAQTIDLLLAGHMHVSHAGHTAVRYKIEGRAAVFVQAGTATSTRGRGEPNAYNLIRLGGNEMLIERNQWQPEQGRFQCVCTDRFEVEREPALAGPPETPDESKVEVEYAGQGDAGEHVIST